MINLSKSKVMAHRQCPKRLWLELHASDLRDDSAAQAGFAIGTEVGEVARRVFDPEGAGELIDIEGLGHGGAIARSRELLAAGTGPVFEAGLADDGGLAYADVMLPIRGTDGSLRWHLIEVKSSTHVKDYQRDDVAFQAMLARTEGVPLESVSVACLDNSFVYPGGGDYRGLFHLTNLTEECASRHEEVLQWLSEARETAALADEPCVETGPHCHHPYGCPFLAYCHRDQSAPVEPEYPLSSLPRLQSGRRAKIEALGIEDLRDVPDEMLTAQQQRVRQSTASGELYFDVESTAAVLRAQGHPAYFLDFETVKFTVPIWAGTRPNQQIPYQYSLHRMDADGTLHHTEFLDLTGDDPSRACAKRLLRDCGDTGPIYVYNIGFERGVIRALAGRFPDLADGLQAISDRLVDLHPIAKAHFYHPSQHGRWSLKSVLPALCPDLSYADLDGVTDGMTAMETYAEAIAPETTPERHAEIRAQLSAYCHLDTLAIVRIWQIFTGRVPMAEAPSSTTDQD